MRTPAPTRPFVRKRGSSLRSRNAQAPGSQRRRQELVGDVARRRSLEGDDGTDDGTHREDRCDREPCGSHSTVAGPVQAVLSLCQLLVVPGPAALHDLLPTVTPRQVAHGGLLRGQDGLGDAGVDRREGDDVEVPAHAILVARVEHDYNALQHDVIECHAQIGSDGTEAGILCSIAGSRRHLESLSWIEGLRFDSRVPSIHPAQVNGSPTKSPVRG